MNKFASLWSFVFFAMAASQLVVNCGMDAAQTNKPVATASVSGPSGPTAMTQPVVANHANGVAMAATTDASQTNHSMATAQASGSASASAELTEYRISQQDILQISVFQINDLNSAVQVSQDGNISLPLIGKVHVAGKTTAETEEIIAAKLRQKYLQSPQVSVSVKTYGKRITVSGAVTGPRVIADDGSTTLSQAIANAGGVADIGNSQRVHVARSKDQHVQDEIYDLDDVQAGKISDPLLQGGDIVVVEQSGVKLALKNLGSLLPFAIFANLF